MSRYKNRVTIAAPEGVNAFANQMAACMGESMADLETFASENYQDGEGNKYFVASTAATDDLLAKAALGNIVRPSFDTEEALNLDEAQAALNMVVIVAPDDIDSENPVYEIATTSKIVAYVNFEPMAAIQHMGLTRIPSEIEP